METVSENNIKIEDKNFGFDLFKISLKNNSVDIQEFTEAFDSEIEKILEKLLERAGKGLFFYKLEEQFKIRRMIRVSDLIFELFRKKMEGYGLKVDFHKIESLKEVLIRWDKFELL